MKVFTILDGFSPSMNGVSFKQVKEFENSRKWSDPALRNYFDTAKVDTQVEKINYYKEFFSRAFAVLLLMALSPLMIIVALAIKISMGGPVLFRQTRVGLGGKLFYIYKFRSMIENAESNTVHTLSWDGDPRITQLGNFLRKSHIDELPQLINVLIGDMYFIGPRPERPEFTREYSQEIKGYNKRHAVKPGITGLAQISCVYDATAEDKLKYDIMYIASRNSLVLNSLITFHTARKVLLMQPTAGVFI